MKQSKYFKPTPKKWRIIGDLSLLLIPVVSVSISQAPDMSEVVRFWLSQGCSWLLIGVKFLTNLTTKSDASK